MKEQIDVAIVGGGIVGLATAWRLAGGGVEEWVRARGSAQIRRVVVLEKEDAVSQHQSGRNSGVVHSGIYYEPGSLKARNCRAGKEALEAFCAEEGIALEQCGKVIVATDEDELPVLKDILRKGKINGVDCEWIGAERLKDIEPGVRGVAAIHVPESGIVDYGAVADRLAMRIRERGGEIWTGARVHGIERRNGTMVVESEQGEVEAKCVVGCAGLQTDRVARMSGLQPKVKIVPFRGEYYDLRPEARELCQGLIYPVPDPKFPFLGVHFTRTIEGGVKCGPNAVLAFAREGYTRWQIDGKELIETLRYRGFRKMATKYWRTGLEEIWRSFSKRSFHRALKKLVPSVALEDLVEGKAGVRAQAVKPDGQLVDDFMIEESEGAVHVLNAPSPAATASLQIGAQVAEMVEEQLH